MCCLFLNVFSVSASEKSDIEVEPYNMMFPCPDCVVGDVTVIIESREMHYDFAYPPCKHGLNEIDVYDLYGRKRKERCNRCGYNEEYYLEDYRVFADCQGY